MFYISPFFERWEALYPFVHRYGHLSLCLRAFSRWLPKMLEDYDKTKRHSGAEKAFCLLSSFVEVRPSMRNNTVKHWENCAARFKTKSIVFLHEITRPHSAVSLKTLLKILWSENKKISFPLLQMCKLWWQLCRKIVFKNALVEICV